MSDYGLREAVLRDPLTGLYNGRYFQQALVLEVIRAERLSPLPLAVLLVGVVGLKAINDVLGHNEGDRVLREIAKRIEQFIRAPDVACRIGGDEFAILTPYAGAAYAEQLYDRLASDLAAQPIQDVPVMQIDAGVAELQPGEDGDSLLRRADEAYYEAKRRRRDDASP